MKTDFEYTEFIDVRKRCCIMDLAQQVLDYRKEVDENQQNVRELVMESYRDIVKGKGRDCNDFFEELEKRYSNDRV